MSEREREPEKTARDSKKERGAIEREREQKRDIARASERERE